MKWSMLERSEGCGCVGEMRPFHLSFLDLSHNACLLTLTQAVRGQLEWERDLRTSGRGGERN